MESVEENPELASTPSGWKRIPRWLRAPYEWWAWLSSAALFCLGGLLMSVLAFALYFVLPRRLGTAVGRRMMMGLFRFFTWYLQLWGIFRLNLKEIDQLRDERGIIIAPNHISLWDVVFIISRLPNVVCIAKASVMRNPIHGGFARLARFIPNDSPNTMVKQAASELRKGACLLVFPEGTRTVKPPINEFRGGFALIAKRAGAPIHTVLLRSSCPLLAKNWRLSKCPDFPYRYLARLGDRFHLEPNADTKKFLSDLRSYFIETLPSDPRNDA